MFFFYAEKSCKYIKMDTWQSVTHVSGISGLQWDDVPYFAFTFFLKKDTNITNLYLKLAEQHEMKEKRFRLRPVRHQLHVNWAGTTDDAGEHQAN